MKHISAAWHTWLYHHARWLYKFLSGYAYDWNCELEELADELRRRIKDLEEQARINEIIRLKQYREEVEC